MTSNDAPAVSPLAGAGLSPTQLTELDAAPVPARSMPSSSISPAAVRAATLTVADLWLPAVTLDHDALIHNLDRFQRWCVEQDADLAPHGKTTMAPVLWSAQLDRGAWALTAATVAQARVMREHGARRVIIANEVTDPGPLAWLAQSRTDPDFTPYCLVDSHEGIRLLETALEDTALTNSAGPLPILVELGVPGRRTGARDTTAALSLARAVAASPHLMLAGVEGFEGVFPQRRDDEAADRVRSWLDALVSVARSADTEGLFAEAEEIVVTAGGSAFPDLVTASFARLTDTSKPVRRVVRSGCYLTHDDLMMERSSPLRSDTDDDPLRPALSCYARVLSVPEPGRALLGAGKRDVSFDIDLPIVRAVLRDGHRHPYAGEARVVELNDHHAFVDLDPATRLEVGEVVELGLSHPCTVFDKWPLIPVVAADGTVVDAIRTLF